MTCRPFDTMLLPAPTKDELRWNVKLNKMAAVNESEFHNVIWKMETILYRYYCIDGKKAYE